MPVFNTSNCLFIVAENSTHWTPVDLFESARQLDSFIEKCQIYSWLCCHSAGADRGDRPWRQSSGWKETSAGNY